MRTITQVETIEIVLGEDEIFNDRWVHFDILSKKVAEYERDNNLGYKSLRNKLYNSYASKKYNTKTIAGIKFVDIKKPMAGAPASLEIKFKKA